MNLVLIGYRGTGKSAVASILADRLGRDVVTMDDEIIRKAGMRIPHIVEQFGWTHFRDLESDVAREVSERDDLIVDTGGGVIERTENVEVLGRGGILFWLTAPADVIVSRIESGAERPPLTAGRTFTQEVEDVLARRTPMYAAAAHHEIPTGNRTVAQVADAIIAHWERAGDASTPTP